MSLSSLCRSLRSGFCMVKIPIREEISQRLDVFLKDGLGLKWGQVQSLLKKQKAFVETKNGTKVRNHSHLLQKDDTIFIDKTFAEKFQESMIESSGPVRVVSDQQYVDSFVDYMTIFDHQDFLVLNKPVGVFSQGSSDPKLSLPCILNSHSIFSQTGERSRIVHRLDIPVSGAIIVAKNSKSARDFSEIFETKKIEKIYEAFVSGIPNFLKDEKVLFKNLKAYIMTNKKTNKAQIDLVKSNPEMRSSSLSAKIKAIYVYMGQKGYIIEEKELGLHPEEHLKKIERLENIGAQILTKIEFDLHTGKKHQIRVVCQQMLDAPILFDTKYGYKMTGEQVEDRVQNMLSSSKFVFSTHPSIQEHFRKIYGEKEYVYLRSEKLVFRWRTSEKENETKKFEIEAAPPAHFEILSDLFQEKFKLD